MVVSLSRGIDPFGQPWIMCPICFEPNELIAAAQGGRLSTNPDGTLSDMCIDCAVSEYLYNANLMGA